MNDNYSNFKEEGISIQSHDLSVEYEEPTTDQKDFNEALSFVEQAIEVQERLEDFSRYLPLEYKSEYDNVLQELKLVVDILDSEQCPLDIVKHKPLASQLRKNKIERLGVAGEVIKLRRHDNKTMQEIGDMFNVSARSVSRFFRYYDGLAPSQKSKYNRKSVFELTERLEELQTMILSQIYSLQGVKDEIAVKYVGELRQSLELAMKVAEKINDSKQMRREYEEFKQTIFDILKQELPHRQGEIIEKMKTFMS